MEGAGATGVDMGSISLSGASPVYVGLVEDANADIKVLDAKMVDLRAAHEARLRITFDPREEELKEQEIQILTSEITRLFAIVGSKLKRLANFDAGAEEAEVKLRKNIQRGVATRLHDMSTEFRKDQKHYIGTIKKLRAGDSLDKMFGGSGEQQRVVDQRCSVETAVSHCGHTHVRG